MTEKKLSEMKEHRERLQKELTDLEVVIKSIESDPFQVWFQEKDQALQGMTRVGALRYAFKAGKDSMWKPSKPEGKWYDGDQDSLEIVERSEGYVRVLAEEEGGGDRVVVDLTSGQAEQAGMTLLGLAARLQRKSS